MSNMLQLHAILSSNLNGHLDATTTLVVGGWKWRYGKRLFMSFSEMRIRGISKVLGIFRNSTLVPLEYLCVLLCAPHLVVWGVHDSVARLCARYRLSHPSVLNMPRVRRVIWKVDWDAPNWIMPNTAKLLLKFHQLSELVLVADYSQDLGYIFKCLSKLRNLRKLRVEIPKRNKPNPFDGLGQVIGANLNLTHLELFLHDYTQVSCSEIFGHVPADSPLKLEHISISNNFSDVQAIVPHIRFLTSINFSARCDQIFPVFQSERIFPPSIQASDISNSLFDYLRGHPHIVSLSIHNTYEEAAGTAMLGIMVQHSESLKYFSTTGRGFYCSLQSVQNIFLLLQRTKLDQLMFIPHDCCHYVVETLPIIARLSNSLTVVVPSPIVFQSCVYHCRQSQDPLVNDLAGRFVCGEPVRGWWWGGYCRNYA
ncbi:hypothetical protein F5887DRAFT_968937 [Amanita rubescens]|nr:hypothetical protein F5887DRAFT_968937 [Amanita rubescens]